MNAHVVTKKNPEQRHARQQFRCPPPLF
jgi:hypothetical protein